MPFQKGKSASSFCSFWHFQLPVRPPVISLISLISLTSLPHLPPFLPPSSSSIRLFPPSLFFARLDPFLALSPLSSIPFLAPASISSAANRIASNRIASNRIESHRIASNRNGTDLALRSSRPGPSIRHLYTHISFPSPLHKACLLRQVQLAGLSPLVCFL